MKGRRLAGGWVAGEEQCSWPLVGTRIMFWCVRAQSMCVHCISWGSFELLQLELLLLLLAAQRCCCTRMGSARCSACALGSVVRMLSLSLEVVWHCTMYWTVTALAGAGYAVR